jgi:hypothetical protein
VERCREKIKARAAMDSDSDSDLDEGGNGWLGVRNLRTTQEEPEAALQIQQQE